MIEPPLNARTIARWNLAALPVPFTVRLFGQFLAPLIRRRCSRRFPTTLATLRHDQVAAERSQSRAELDADLGPPVWVCPAHEYATSGKVEWLDRVEHFEPKGSNVCFDVLIASRDCPCDRISLDVQGDLQLNSWERVAGVGDLWEQYRDLGRSENDSHRATLNPRETKEANRMSPHGS